jgi:hypothetical protein
MLRVKRLLREAIGSAFAVWASIYLARLCGLLWLNTIDPLSLYSIVFWGAPLRLFLGAGVTVMLGAGFVFLRRLFHEDPSRNALFRERLIGTSIGVSLFYFFLNPEPALLLLLPIPVSFFVAGIFGAQSWIKSNRNPESRQVKMHEPAGLVRGGIGVILGLVGSYGLGEFVRSFVPGSHPDEPFLHTFLTPPPLLLIVLLGAMGVIFGLLSALIAPGQEKYQRLSGGMFATVLLLPSTFLLPPLPIFVVMLPLPVGLFVIGIHVGHRIRRRLTEIRNGNQGTLVGERGHDI